MCDDASMASGDKGSWQKITLESELWFTSTSLLPDRENRGLNGIIWNQRALWFSFVWITLQALVTMISLHLTHSTTGGETAKKWITYFKMKMSQFIAQMFQAGAVTECAGALLSFRYPRFIDQSKTSPLKSTRKGTTARWCDIRHQILEFFVAQCTLVKSGAVQSG